LPALPAAFRATFRADFDAIIFGAAFEAKTARLAATSLLDTTGATRRVLAMIAFWVAVRLLIKDFFWIDIALSSDFFITAVAALLCCKPHAKSWHRQKMQILARVFEVRVAKAGNCHAGG
jgi:steroid 5-alpha reductase family enzyme